MNDALALIEIGGWAAAMVVLDAMEKMAGVRVLQTELNDRPGVCLKLHGSLADVQAATAAAETTASGMRVAVIAHVIPAPSPRGQAAYEAAADYNPLFEQSTVQYPRPSTPR